MKVMFHPQFYGVESYFYAEVTDQWAKRNVYGYRCVVYILPSSIYDTVSNAEVLMSNPLFNTTNTTIKMTVF